MPVRRPRFITAVMTGALAVSLLSAAFSADQPPSAPSVTILYPKQDAAVGRRVNLVLDPATDWSAVPFFQVLVGSTEYPVVDTSTSRHAVQGLALERGLNSITVRVLVPAPVPGTGAGKDKDAGKGTDPEKKSYRVVQSRSIGVYNREGSFSVTPSRYAPSYFHTRENEGDCSGCHRLEAEAKDRKHERPQDVLCYACHRDIPAGKHIHGPSAVWNCLACHDPNRSPVRYQFTATDLWNVTKATQPVEPAVFTLSADALFVPRTAVLLTEESATDPSTLRGRAKDKKKEQEPDTARQAELAGRQEKQRELFRELLELVKQNPLDRIRVEVHGDSEALSGEKGDKANNRISLQQLTDARAHALVRVLQEYGIADTGRIIAAGMGNTMPNEPGTSKDAPALNNRIEIIVYPRDMNVRSSRELPTIADRERVVVNMSYARGPAVGNLKVIEQLPMGSQYVKGSAVVRGHAKEPQIKGNELVWQLGDAGTNFQENITYIVKKGKNAAAVNPVVRVEFTSGKNEQVRDFDPSLPDRRVQAVQDVCARCHPNVLAGPVKHGPAEMGYCTLCHDPHAGNYPSWTRNQAWQLCTTCHAEKKTEVHLISGFVRGVSHPTEKARDPSRPGKRLTCVSCHAPHSAQTRELLGFDVRNKFEMCKYCHPGK